MKEKSVLFLNKHFCNSCATYLTQEIQILEILGPEFGLGKSKSVIQ